MGGMAQRLQFYLAVLALVSMTACVSTKQASVVPCKMAVVNPVSGNAECVEPRGAAVDPPPPRPAPTQAACSRHGDVTVDECGRSSKSNEH
jgi:hypothetical protein